MFIQTEATPNPATLKFIPGRTVLDTDNLESEVADLKRRGLVTSPIEQQPWGRFVTFDDPDGNGFVLQQAAPGA